MAHFKSHQVNNVTDYHYIIKGCVITVSYGSTTVTCAVGQGGTLDVDFDIGELFGQEDVDRQDEWVERYHPRISIAHSKFDGKLIGELFGASASNEDFDGNTKTNYTKYSITGSTYDHPTFTIRGTFYTKDQDHEYQFEVTEVIFTNLSLPFPAEGGIVRNLQGVGNTVNILLPTAS